MTYYGPDFFAECSDQTLRTLHSELAPVATHERWNADILAARVAELSAEMARREGNQATTDIGQMTVTLTLRWAKDNEGYSLLLLAGHPVGTVFLMGRDPEWWHACGQGLTAGVRIRNLSTQAEAMAALQAAVLKALAE